MISQKIIVIMSSACLRSRVTMVSYQPAFCISSAKNVEFPKKILISNPMCPGQHHQKHMKLVHYDEIGIFHTAAAARE